MVNTGADVCVRVCSVEMTELIFRIVITQLTVKIMHFQEMQKEEAAGRLLWGTPNILDSKRDPVEGTEKRHSNKP